MDIDEVCHNLAKSGSEAAHQMALMAWASWLPTQEKYPELRWLFAIPNGGARGDARTARIRGGQLKAQGVKAGVPDLFLPIIRLSAGLYGLWIEMKKPDEKPVRVASKGGLSDKQMEFRDYLMGAGYAWVVCYSWEEARAAIISYLECI